MKILTIPEVIEIMPLLYSVHKLVDKLKEIEYKKFDENHVVHRLTSEFDKFSRSTSYKLYMNYTKYDFGFGIMFNNNILLNVYSNYTVGSGITYGNFNISFENYAYYDNKDESTYSECSECSDYFDFYIKTESPKWIKTTIIDAIPKNDEEYFMKSLVHELPEREELEKYFSEMAKFCKDTKTDSVQIRGFQGLATVIDIKEDELYNQKLHKINEICSDMQKVVLDFLAEVE